MAMMPGYFQHEIDAVRQQRDEVLTALRQLTNEAAGFVSMADPFAHGHTNITVLMERIALARAVIAKVDGKEA